MTQQRAQARLNTSHSWATAPPKRVDPRAFSTALTGFNVSIWAYTLAAVAEVIA